MFGRLVAMLFVLTLLRRSGVLTDMNDLTATLHTHPSASVDCSKLTPHTVFQM